MTLNFYKIGFLILIAIFLYLIIPANKVVAQNYMFCPIFTSGGQPQSNGCHDSLETCNRMSHVDTVNKGKVMCVAKPRNSSMSQ